MKINLLLVGPLIALTAAACISYQSTGYVAHVGELDIELFVGDGRLALYFWDQTDRPIEGRLVTAGADVVSGENRAIIHFVPIGESLQGRVPFSIARDAMVLVTFSVSGGREERASFSLDGRVPGQAR